MLHSILEMTFEASMKKDLDVSLQAQNFPSSDVISANFSFFANGNGKTG